MTGLLLLVSEALVVVLTIFRRRAHAVDRSIAGGAAVTGVSLVGPPLLRAGGAAPLLADSFTAGFSTFGLCLVIAGKVVLGRSFGLVPANRGVVAQGPYGFMRHPIYTGYLLTHVGFLAAHPTRVEHRPHSGVRHGAHRARADRGACARPGRAVPRVLRPRRAGTWSRGCSDATVSRTARRRWARPC